MEATKLVTRRGRSAGALIAVAMVACLVAWAAGSGSSTASAAPAAPAAKLRPLATGLDQPIYVTPAPGEPGRLYIVEQTGRIKVLDSGKLRATPFLDLSARVSCCGERGLLSMVFDPGYAKNRRLYVNYTDASGATVVARYRSDGRVALPGSAKTLLRVAQPYPNHNGGGLQFGPDGLLYVGMGDGGSGGDPEGYGQRRDTRLGKLLTIDPATGRVAVAGTGLRNPWRFSFDRATGDLWVADVGQNMWEEVNRVSAGSLPGNFGWAAYEGVERFKEEKLDTSMPLVVPVAVYSHDDGCSVTGGYVYRGKAVASLRGRYVYGDYCSGTVWSLPATATSQSGSTPRREPWRVQQLVSFGEDAAGELLTVSQSGTVSRLVP